MRWIWWIALLVSGRWDAQEKETPEKIVLDLGGGVKMEFVRVRAGKFMMGSNDGNEDEKPAHEVTLSKDFWIQTTETTQAQWKAVMGSNPSSCEGDDLPVERVSWENSQEFVKRLNETAKGQLQGKQAGLPTEAQWEYACRAGEKGKWCFGDDEKKLGEYSWNDTKSDKKIHPVAQKKANAWGLYDMHGNVWEWCEDWYGEKYLSPATTDPTGPAQGDLRVLRGGSWFYIDYYVPRSALRQGFGPSLRVSGFGLRVVLAAP